MRTRDTGQQVKIFTAALEAGFGCLSATQVGNTGGVLATNAPRQTCRSPAGSATKLRNTGRRDLYSGASDTRSQPKNYKSHDQNSLQYEGII